MYIRDMDLEFNTAITSVFFVNVCVRHACSVQRTLKKVMKMCMKMLVCLTAKRVDCLCEEED